MPQKSISRLLAALLFVSVMAGPSIGRAQQATMQQDDGAYYLGSMIFSIFYLPIKLVTCLGTQVGAGAAYVATYGVEGNYEGGTNGKEIGEVARRSCTGDWVISPQQVKKDYGN